MKKTSMSQPKKLCPVKPGDVLRQIESSSGAFAKVILQESHEHPASGVSELAPEKTVKCLVRVAVPVDNGGYSLALAFRSDEEVLEERLSSGWGVDGKEPGYRTLGVLLLRATVAQCVADGTKIAQTALATLENIYNAHLASKARWQSQIDNARATWLVADEN